MTQLPATADIVIVGGGVMGASTAFHLAQRGTKNVVLLEREQFFGAGATGRCAGGIRHQFATAINIELSKVSLRMLDDFEAVTGRPALVRKCGYMFVLTRAADVARFEQTIALQRSLGIQTEWLDGAQVQRRLPACRFADALGGTFFKEDGLADPNSVVMGYIDAARRLGATCHSGVSVTGMVSAGGRISAVHTNAGAISTPIVINTCGPWSAALAQMAELALPVVPVRRQWLTTTALPDLPPDFPFVVDFSQSLYFHREGGGVLTGMSDPLQAAGIDQSVDPAWELTHMDRACARLPALEEAGVVSRLAGLYEVTPDAHPIIGATPVPGFYVLAGFSGHGFMHGPVCGLLLAELLVDGAAHSIDISALDYARFAEGRAIAEYNVI